MKYKYFSILSLAVYFVFGHITFSEEGISLQEYSANWWSQNTTDYTLFTKFDDTEEELRALMTTEKRLSLIEKTLTESQKNIGKEKDSQIIDIRELQKLARDLRKEIAINKEEITKIEKDSVLINQEIERVKTRQKEMAVFIKKTFAEGYKDKLLAKSDFAIYSLFFKGSFGNNTAQGDKKTLIQNSTENLLARQKSLQADLEVLEKNLKRKIKSKKNLSEKLAKENEELRQAEDVEKNILFHLGEKEENLSSKLSLLTTKKKNIQTKINQQKTENATQIETKFSEYENILKERFSSYNCGTEKSAACKWMEKYISMERDALKENTILENFVWPLQPNSGLGYHFRDQNYYNVNNTHHEGVDIIADPGIPVQSVANGYILIKKNPTNESSGMVIVKHSNGFMSVYIGIKPNSKPMFSKISAGDSIGTTDQHAEHSNKNNIHVELYEKGKAIDLLEKIDLSLLKKEDVPSRYGWKYIDDVKRGNKKINLEELQKSIKFFYIEGENEGERQRKFLETYASPSFQDRALWISESLPESIDPTFVMCVGFAESSLGKNLTTNDNIGNVGNTDSGARRDYNDPQSGVRAIASVVNNNWLGGYTTIDQLSGWGNPKGPIYASSPTNWHENIVKCMSAIKQKYVGNTSAFRLNQASLLLYQQEGFSNKKDL